MKAKAAKATMFANHLADIVQLYESTDIDEILQINNNNKTLQRIISKMFEKFKPIIEKKQQR